MRGLDEVENRCCRQIVQIRHRPIGDHAPISPRDSERNPVAHGGCG